MRTIAIDADTPIGAPAPFVFTARQIESLSRALVEVEWVREAHVPAIGREQSLLLVPRRGAATNLAAIGAALGASLQDLPVGVMQADDPRLPLVRALDVRAYRAPEGSSRFHDLLLMHLGPVLDRGLALHAWLDDHEQALDMQAGTIVLRPSRFFSRKRRFAMQVLGTESPEAGIFTWAWADPERIPANLARACDVVRRRGEQESIPELTSPTVLLDEVGAVPLAVVACGILRASVNCRVQRGADAVHVAITDSIPQLERVPSGDDVADIVDMFGSWTLRSAKAAIESLARARGFSLVRRDGWWVVTGVNGDGISFQFDAEGRIRATSRISS